MSVTFQRLRPTRTAALAALAVSCLLPATANALPAPLPPQVQLSDGIIEGMRVPPVSHSLRRPTVQVFRGIPYAAPPVGELRWHEPQPVARWAGVRPAKQFGPRCMQLKTSGHQFGSNEMSEDCLYLNVWTPAARNGQKLPVLVYFHGGGFVSGDASEARYDGSDLAARGMIVVTVNYRLGAFGFLALPEAASESSHGTTGNYGLLDQVAALRWVRDNIAQFGGDPSQVTIAGNSAGSVAVSAHMASPLSRGLFARAIGESGAAFAPLGFSKRDEAERSATQFAAMLGGASLQQLRTVSAEIVLAAAKTKSAARFWPHVDGHFLTDAPESVYSNGQQAPVPLMLGSNSQEGHFSALLGGKDPTPENWRQTIKTMFPNRAEEVLAHYPGNDKDEVMHAGTALASDLFVGHSTWRWMQLHQQGGRAPVYFYHYNHPRPPAVNAQKESKPQPVLGAAHSAEIEYALGNLAKQRRYAWTALDYDISRIFSGYVEQFVKTGNPNGTGTAIGSGSVVVADAAESASPSGASNASETSNAVQSVPHHQIGLLPIPNWPAVRADNRGILRQVIGEKTHASWDREAPRQGVVERLLESRSWNGPVAPNDSATSTATATTTAPTEQ